jgi:hypothetical protein
VSGAFPCSGRAQATFCSYNVHNYTLGRVRALAIRS